MSEWIITQLSHQSTDTFQEFFNGPVTSILNNQSQLQAVYVGPNKFDAETPVFPLDMRMNEAMTVFGRYVKFVVE